MIRFYLKVFIFTFSHSVCVCMCACMCLHVHVSHIVHTWRSKDNLHYLVLFLHQAWQQVPLSHLAGPGRFYYSYEN